MSSDVAALNLMVNSDSVEQANVSLRAMPAAASAAERAAQKFSATTMNAANSNDQFSRRTRTMVASLEFERQQLLRGSAEREKYTALRRAGVTAMSGEGQAIAASVAALQAQRAAAEASNKALTGTQIVAKAGSTALSVLKTSVLSLAAAFSIEAIISRVSEALREVADLGETADQIGITVKGLQALQFQAVQNGISLEQLNTGIGKFSENIGKAAEGDKSMIESLQGLKVKILDVHGNLLPTEDLLVEVAKRIVAIDDPARQTAAAVDFFGKAGKSLIPTLREVAKGFDEMSAQAKAAGAIISAEAIAKLDALADSSARSHLVMRAFFAENAAGPLTEIIDYISKRISNLSLVIKGVREDLVALLALAANPLSIVPKILGDTPADAIAKKISAAQSTLSAMQDNLANAQTDRDRTRMNVAVGRAQADLTSLQQQQNVMNVGGKASPAAPGDPDAIGVRVNMPPKGVRDPITKASGSKSDPYAKAIESAKEYTALKNAETAAIGLNVNEAARLKHEQELINKASEDANKLTPTQIANLKSLAAAMAEADAKFATAKFMDDASKTAEQFIATQQIERDTLLMSTEAAMAYRLEQEALNKAKADGIVLSDAEKQKLGELAGAQAAAAEKTRQMKDMVDFAKSTVSGFFSDLKQGLQDGKSVVESFGNAFMNVLNKIEDKLMQMAIDDLFNAAFGGKAGGASSGGGLGSLLGGGISNILGGGSWGSAAAGVGSTVPDFIAAGGFAFAKGAAFRAGNVIPFAGGGVVSRPTAFPMAGGRTGLTGEAGEEGILPLRRGRGGRLGVEASGGGGSPRIVIEIAADSEWVRATARDESGQVVAQSAPAIVDKAVAKSAKVAPAAVESDKQMRTKDWRLGSV